MKGINKVTIVGRLGSDPEVRYLPNNTPTVTISVATSEKWNDKDTGNEKEKTEWHRIVFYRKLAEIAGEYLTKGSIVYIEGKLQTRKWQDKHSGEDRYMTEIIANEMQMLPSGSSKIQTERGKPVMPVENAIADDDFDDDIPF